MSGIDDAAVRGRLAVNLSAAATDDLLAVLADLVDGARHALTDNFLGAYLQGSFALGAGDADSDVDFLVVTAGDVDGAQLAALADMHARFPDSPVGWAQHLEGSYIPAAELRGPAGAGHGGGWLYVDNGSRRIEESSHDDTGLMRWVLREHGIVLAGPAPVTLLEPVAPAELRTEAVATARRWQESIEATDGTLSSALAQQQHVLALCRVLYTLEHAEVTSKELAARWALRALDPRWRPLITRAIDERPHPWERVHQQADERAVRNTYAFGAYASERSHTARRAQN
ncbi:MAG TPA: aminoglycoside adenylyltransferase domain-containing protein [Actinopolymorphaceae bacterium]|jgi:hypothetical protein